MSNEPDSRDAKLNELCMEWKSKGVVTYTEVMNQLQDVGIDAEMYEAVLDRLEGLGIRVVSEAHAGAKPEDTHDAISSSL